MAIQLMCDSTAYLERNFLMEHKVKMIPLTYRFRGTDHRENAGGEDDGFFYELSHTHDFPVTSQPPVGEFVSIFTKSLEADRQVLMVTLSSKISGTYNAARLAANMVDENRIAVVDSLGGGMTERFLMEKAVVMKEEGCALGEIAEALEKLRKRTNVLFTVPNLDYLHQGGRLSRSKALIGNLLHLSPIISLKDGMLVAEHLERGMKKAVKAMIGLVPESVSRISVAHILNLEGAKQLAAALQEKFQNAKVTIDKVGPVFGAHLGPGSLGLGYVYG
ncbi:DegV family protein [Gehongia tenuis]|uniref:DegV family protein n=1 Tax=Gehongia tenuis TaxID=2763655 RepID=A0A926D0V6_9FIRM|nr:DegV family protein [Gehongia tenuis]MBC8530305.1 DegV family protein [Gehongia tenuis]